MRVGICSTVWCLEDEVDDLLDKYPWIKDYNFIVNENYDYDHLGTIDIPSFDEILEILNKIDCSIIIHKTHGETPMILEIYDGYRE